MAGTSRKESDRAGPSSADMNARPNPLDPRTFGANTVRPAAASDCESCAYAGRS